MNRNRFVLLFEILFFQCFNSFCVGQGYNLEKTALSNYLVRIYEQQPFEGVRMIDDYYSQYLISVVTLNPSDYQDEYMMERVSEVEAQSQANRFFNGSKITETEIVRVNEKCDGKKDSKVIKKINEKSSGYVRALELLISFDELGKKVYFYISKIQ